MLISLQGGSITSISLTLSASPSSTLEPWRTRKLPSHWQNDRQTLEQSSMHRPYPTGNTQHRSSIQAQWMCSDHANARLAVQRADCCVCCHQLRVYIGGMTSCFGRSLNMFLSELVLASPSTTTDEEYARIEGVIAHE